MKTSRQTGDKGEALRARREERKLRSRAGARRQVRYLLLAALAAGAALYWALGEAFVDRILLQEYLVMALLFVAAPVVFALLVLALRAIFLLVFRRAGKAQR